MDRIEGERSGGFCCPAPPGAAEFPSVARWVQPRSFWVMSGREAINYAARARASLSLALVSFAQFNGLHGPGESIVFQHTSILVRPRQKAPEKGPLWWSRRVLPPGPLRLLHDTIYHHSRANPAAPIWRGAPAFSSRAWVRPVRPGSGGRRTALQGAARLTWPEPSVPASAPASGRATPPDRRRSCGIGRTCPLSAPLPHGHDA